MKIRAATTLIIAAMLSCFGSFAASACDKPVSLVAIEQRIADPNLSRDLKDKASALKTSAAAAIESGHRDEGRMAYRELQVLLGISSPSGKYRCN